MSGAISLHKKLKGKIELKSKIRVSSESVMSKVYTPGVAEVSREISRNKKKSFELTNRANSIAIVSDGSRVLGLGNIGPEAAMPVMEGKSMLFKEFGQVDAYPVCVRTQDEDEIVELVKNISPSFGGINIEDIDSPKCLAIVDRLSKEVDIPVFHDDRHGTGIVVLAGVINALKVVRKNMKDVRIVVAGSGAAGHGIVDMLLMAGARDILVLDSRGIIYRGRDGLDRYKVKIAEKTNRKCLTGGLGDAMDGADVFIGVSGKGGMLDGNMVRRMARDPIVFAISNPDPEIHPVEAKKNGAKIVATGRSDFPNQVNNQLAFPGVMRGLLDSRKNRIDDKMLLMAAKVIASHVKKPRPGKIVPNAFDKSLPRLLSRKVGSL